MNGRRKLLRLGALSLAAIAVTSWRSPAHSAARRIELIASRFQFSLARIEARRGETLVLAIRSPDLVHGFSLPELNRRVDVMPGATAELVLPELRAGQYAFLCDNFCGEEHDKMTGLLVVSA